MSTTPTDDRATASPWQRRLISAALLIHLAAVVAPPLNFATVDAGPARWLYVTLRPYSQAAYLDHGYFFFAPDPGPSHLIRYRAEFADDREPHEEMFPDWQRQWPRLLYHRHFMLSEHLNAMFAPAEPPAGMAPERLTDWRSARQSYETRWAGFQQHLRAALGAEQVQLTRVEHRPPDPGEVLAGRELNAAELYEDLSETAAPPRTGPAPLRPTAPVGPIVPLAPGPLVPGPLVPGPLRPGPETIEPAGRDDAAGREEQP